MSDRRAAAAPVIVVSGPAGVGTTTVSGRSARRRAQAARRFAAVDLDRRHVVDASGSPAEVRDAILRAFRPDQLVVDGAPHAS